MIYLFLAGKFESCENWRSASPTVFSALPVSMT
ncbi:hypothetical protein BRADI_1g14455v3 [Brachypodium distachyon]|uniref:Uncharacterized protein n=1 Tax=Brachypodium distachyon TaxID=15368 RepID=A0A2K2DJG1_BRADI|nr:hypothetical protein BRADI_1g14455v3 [Brachypodium distachyon]